MTPTPEICKNCRHQSPVFKQVPILLDCRVWKITVPEYHSCQHFESREKPPHFQQLKSWLEKFDAVQKRTVKSKLQLL